MRILTTVLVLAAGTLVAAGQSTSTPVQSQGQGQGQGQTTMTSRPTGDLKDAADRTRKATEAFMELVNGKDNGIPTQLLSNAEAVIVIPTLVKGGFIAGAKHGKGIVSVRRSATADASAMTGTGNQTTGAGNMTSRMDGAWTGPAFIKMTGGSIGWQIGVESVDLVLLVMNRKGVDDLLDDRFTIGGSLSVAAGPLGRSGDAATSATAGAGVLGYSRAQGLFAGATLEGAAIKNDEDENQALYGFENAHLRTILMNGIRPVAPVPTEIQQWQDTLGRVAARR